MRLQRPGVVRSLGGGTEEARASRACVASSTHPKTNLPGRVDRPAVIVQCRTAKFDTDPPPPPALHSVGGSLLGWFAGALWCVRYSQWLSFESPCRTPTIAMVDPYEKTPTFLSRPVRAHGRSHSGRPSGSPVYRAGSGRGGSGVHLDRL